MVRSSRSFELTDLGPETVQESRLVDDKWKEGIHVRGQLDIGQILAVTRSMIDQWPGAWSRVPSRDPTPSYREVLPGPNGQDGSYASSRFSLFIGTGYTDTPKDCVDTGLADTRHVQSPATRGPNRLEHGKSNRRRVSQNLHRRQGHPPRCDAGLIIKLTRPIPSHTPAAQRFIESYYPALQTSRSTLDTFYVPSSSLSDGKTVPTIVFNGNVIPDPLALRTLFEKQMPHAHYEVQSYDCQVLNPDYSLAGPGRFDPSSGKNMSVVLTVSGYVRYGESRDAALRGFSENFVLIPNPDGGGSSSSSPGAARGRGTPRRDWLVQSQNFRLVV
ncbi:MAG: hypothetical protein M1816_003133 [Peltula sp. TS41687]|nr:MAG: hypothetical protein M1816_003133 [Peltula sp. TS41687]